MDFFERVKEKCKEQKVSVRDLIESTGMNYDSYNGLKRYNNFPRLNEAMEIAKKLNTSVDYLMNGDMSSDEINFLETFRKVPDNLKTWVIESLEELVKKL